METTFNTKVKNATFFDFLVQRKEALTVIYTLAFVAVVIAVIADTLTPNTNIFPHNISLEFPFIAQEFYDVTTSGILAITSFIIWIIAMLYSGIRYSNTIQILAFTTSLLTITSLGYISSHLIITALSHDKINVFGICLFSGISLLVIQLYIQKQFINDIKISVG